LKNKEQAKLSPIPKSGNFSSFLTGVVVSLVTLVIFIENTKVLFPSVEKAQSNNKNETVIEWQTKQNLPTEKIKKFVEANPDVPENPPDRNQQFSFRDQQAAQPLIKDKQILSKLPKIKGKYDSVKIVNSTESEPLPEIRSPIQSEKKSQNTETKPSIKKNPKSKNELIVKNDKEGIQLKKSDIHDNGRDALIASLKRKDVSIATDIPKIPTTKPKKRPKLSKELINGPVMKSLSNAPRLGTVAIECRLHPYGIYIQKMLQSIEEQWNQLATGSTKYLQKDRLPDLVTWRFTLEADGSISNLHRIDNGKESLPTELCRQAIASRVPFGEWSDKMIEDFGKSDEITINFRYL
jgi:hypothetical protein